MAVPFPYQRRPDDDPTVVPDDQPPAYPTIDPNADSPAPVVNPKASFEAPAEPPAIDPAIMSSMKPSADTSKPALVSATPSSTATSIPGTLDEHSIRSALNMRPERDMTISDPTAREEDYKNRVTNYEPQAARGWWNRYLKPLVLGSLAGAKTGNPWGLLGGAIGGTAIGAVKPTLEDEKWKAGELKEAQDRIDQNLETAKTRATIEDMQARPELARRKLDAQALHEKGVQEQREWSRRFQEGKQDTYEDYLQWKMDNGDQRADTADGQAEIRKEYLKIRKDAQADKVRHEKVTEGQGAERNRQGQERIDNPRPRSGMDPQVRGAQQAIAKFNQLTTRIATANSLQDYPTAKALMDERNSHEERMRQLYGDILVDDDNHKPTRLSPDVTTGAGQPAPTGGYKIEGAIKAFKAKHGRDPNKAETARMQNQVDLLNQ